MVLDQFNTGTLSDLVQITQFIFSHVAGKRDVGKWTSVFQLINTLGTSKFLLSSFFERRGRIHNG